jgi:hypothetical protein
LKDNFPIDFKLKPSLFVTGTSLHLKVARRLIATSKEHHPEIQQAFVPRRAVQKNPTRTTNLDLSNSHQRPTEHFMKQF